MELELVGKSCEICKSYITKQSHCGPWVNESVTVLKRGKKVHLHPLCYYILPCNALKIPISKMNLGKNPAYKSINSSSMNT